MKFWKYSLIKTEKLNKIVAAYDLQEQQISNAADFIKKIESGNLEISLLEDEADQSILAASLESMRAQMKKFAIEEKERNWVTEGLAKFVEILRTGNDNTEALAFNIISSLVKYMNANQGAFYIVNDENSADVYLQMVACYAYERKKHLIKRIEPGEGLAGQAMLEKQTIYMTNIPNDFIKITSGLGQALPRNLLIVPLKMEEQVLGVVEIASFNVIKEYQIKFIERLGESIASSIATVKINQRTQKLLEESQSQTEQMRAQEEEMRQNMEELAATQEEMHRVLKEVQGKEAFITNLLNATNDSILAIDTNYKIITCNKATSDTYKAYGLDVSRGFDVMNLFTADQKPVYKRYYDRVFAGERFDVTEKYRLEDKDQYFTVTYSPLKDERGNIIGASAFGKDVSETVFARQHAEELLSESQHQAEELKAQEEELRQNMEELAATQEEMQRVLDEVQRQEYTIRELLNTSRDSVLTLDANFKLQHWNSVFAYNLEKGGIKLDIGFDILQIFSPEVQEKKIALYKRVFAGETFEDVERFDINGAVNYYLVKHAPLHDQQNKVVAIAIHTTEVTELVQTRARLEEAEAEIRRLKATQ